MDGSEAKRLRSLEPENTKFKRIVADQILGTFAIQKLLVNDW